ncbi:MAG: hypothetical protein WDA21_01190 [Bacilli bacterium]
MNKINIFFNRKDIYYNIDKFPNESNVLFITGLSGSGKSYLSKQLAVKYNAVIFRLEWLKHYKHCNKEGKVIIDSFIKKYPKIKPYVANKWNNESNEDKNELFTKYILLLYDYFIKNIDKDKIYIIDGLQVFTKLEPNNYPLIIKGTSSIKSLINRFKRDYDDEEKVSLKTRIKYIIEKKDIKDIPVKYVYEINANDWVYFLWEKNINQ